MARSRSSSTRDSRNGNAATRAFTLVEILIVIVILGILATIVIPQFSDASHQARENTLKDDLRYLRMQVQVYKAQHRDISPGYPGGAMSASPTEGDFIAQMTLFTAEDCSTSSSASSTYRFGPYLSRMPPNPLNSESSIYVVANGLPMPQGSDLPLMNGSNPYGWVFKPQTQEFMVNLAGSDNSGAPYANY
ncbi:MAG: prepilin-type N-terminal cleavage/methylation domain-containing protein [Tepidisphaeraceae bacterium]